MKYAILTLFAIVLASTVNAEAPVTYEFESGILNPADTGREMGRSKYSEAFTNNSQFSIHCLIYFL